MVYGFDFSNKLPADLKSKAEAIVYGLSAKVDRNNSCICYDAVDRTEEDGSLISLEYYCTLAGHHFGLASRDLSPNPSQQRPKVPYLAWYEEGDPRKMKHIFPIE